MDLPCHRCFHFQKTFSIDLIQGFLKRYIVFSQWNWLKNWKRSKLELREKSLNHVIKSTFFRQIFQTLNLEHWPFLSLFSKEIILLGMNFGIWIIHRIRISHPNLIFLQNAPFKTKVVPISHMNKVHPQGIRLVMNLESKLSPK